MKTTKLKPFFILLFFIFFLPLSSISQNMLQSDISQQREAEAKSLVEQLDLELELRAKQEMLMQKKFVEFALKRDEILKLNLPPREELEQLALLKLEETKDMHDILTKPQYDRYVFLMQRGIDKQ